VRKLVRGETSVFFVWRGLLLWLELGLCHGVWSWLVGGFKGSCGVVVVVGW
jgi:hypothetical protein